MTGGNAGPRAAALRTAIASYLARPSGPPTGGLRAVDLALRILRGDADAIGQAAAARNGWLWGLVILACGGVLSALGSAPAAAGPAAIFVVAPLKLILLAVLATAILRSALTGACAVKLPLLTLFGPLSFTFIWTWLLIFRGFHPLLGALPALAGFALAVTAILNILKQLTGLPIKQILVAFALLVVLLLILDVVTGHRIY